MLGRTARIAFRYNGLMALCALLVALPASARRRHRRRHAARQAPRPRASAAIKRLVLPFKWGMSHSRVENLLIKQLRKRYYPLIHKASGNSLRQDRLRNELTKDIRSMRKSFIRFDGRKSNWDGSIVDDQFVHKNNESMLVVLDRDQQRFFFFFHDRLYKVMIAFNNDHPKYKGLTFPKFVSVLIQAYGQGKPVFLPDAAGINKLHHVEWEGSGHSILWALNKTEVYGNLCLVVMDKPVLTQLMEGRKLVSSMTTHHPAVNPLIQAISRPPSKNVQEENGQQHKP